MKEFILTEEVNERAVLVGLITPAQNEAKANEYLDELAFLAETAGAEPVKKFLQRIEQPNSVTFVGSGKLSEIKKSEPVKSTVDYKNNIHRRERNRSRYLR